MTTYCRDCDNVHSATRKDDPWRWRCVKVPIRPGYGFVDPDHAPNPPYERCSKVNAQGTCPEFVPVRHVETGK
jgi:hypothetical protein